MELHKFQNEIKKKFNIIEIERMTLLNQNDVFHLFLRLYISELDGEIRTDESL